MPPIQSNTISLGSPAPDFTLTDVKTKSQVSIRESRGKKGTLVMFICNHCPYVVHCIDCIASMAEEWQPKGVAFLAICSNDVENYPDDSPEKMVAFAQERKLSFPYLFDGTQDTARAYQAACTPEFYLFDAELSLFYHGRLDDSRPNGQSPVTGKDMAAALEALTAGLKPPENQMPSIGCSIKWKPTKN